MNGEFSIQAAAQECPDACALITRSRCFTYSELAKEVQSVSLSNANMYRAQSPFLSALRLYASLEAKRCITFVDRETPTAPFEMLLKRLPTKPDDQLALIVFTSGSSGLPKGVQLSRRALLASAQASGKRLGWFPHDRWLCALPLSHIGGLSILLRCLVARKTVVLCDGFDAGEIATTIQSEHVTHISLVPTMLWRLLKNDFNPPEHLRVTLMGGAAMDTALIQQARDIGLTLQLSYGLSESASMILSNGEPLSGVELRVQDGRLAIKSPTLMNGYLPPHNTTASITDGWFQTEDSASIQSNGGVTIHGRVDDIIISGGENINPRDVENGLLASDHIDAAYALGLPHDEWGQELVALVVRSPFHSSEQKSPYTTLPGHHTPKALIVVDSLPLLTNGKIDRDRARAIALTWRSNTAD